jgi:phosphatidylserine/phosphatidylglycerophosphate/cardiolipin synthase-like enzyme
VTIDGKDTFEQVYGHVLNACKSILIANYDLDPHLRFARAYPAAAGRRPFQIKSSCAKPIACSVADRSRRYSLQDLLLEKARAGVEVKVIVWQPRLVLRLLPGADERGIDGRADDVEVLNSIAKSYGLGDMLQVKIDSTAPTLTSAHHEKIMVIDDEVGFCGGLDLSNGKWDTSAHDYESQLRDPNAEPWHDVHAVVRGPVVRDLAYHFRQRWSYADLQDRRAVRTAVHLASAPPAAGDIPVVALRTWKEMDRNGGVKAWYGEMFRKAKTGIYIENQFPFQSRSLTRLLARRLAEEPGLRVVVVGPMEPNLPGLVGSMLSKMSVNDVNRNLADLRRLSGGRVATYSLISQHRAIPNMRKQIYVHSKVMIVDDQWMTIGSANLDKNGTDDSSEFNLGITSAELAAKTRIRLWQEHTGGSVPQSVLADFGDGFDAWKKLARANGVRASANRPITGSIYFYNFEEEGLSPPYPEAKGGNRFALL